MAVPVSVARPSPPVAAPPQFGKARSRAVAVGVSVAKAVVPFALLVAIWWLVKVVYDLDDRVLVAPPDVVRATFELIHIGVLPEFLAHSLWRLLRATALSIAIGVPVGLLLGASRWVARASEQFVRFLLAMSAVAWLPLVILWYGLSDTTLFVIIVYTASLPIVLNTMTGLRAIPQRLLESVRTLGGGRRREVTDVYLPGAVASIVVGIRLAIGYGWRALIAGEMIIGAQGVGFLIFNARQGRQVDRIMAGMVVIGVTYIVIDRLVLKPLETMTSHTSSGT